MMPRYFKEEFVTKNGETLVITATGDDLLVNRFASREIDNIRRYGSDQLQTFEGISLMLKNGEEEEE
jgi:bifunctional DNA-binding transcriptional regulator/antitoxin component of YhaV-PrlF toxin-antitoxin module